MTPSFYICTHLFLGIETIPIETIEIGSGKTNAHKNGENYQMPIISATAISIRRFSKPSNVRFFNTDFYETIYRTMENLQSGSITSVLNIVMQLRKCCNHPNLFETRPVLSPFAIRPLNISMPLIIDLERADQLSMAAYTTPILGSRCANLLMTRISQEEVLKKYANREPDMRMPIVKGFKYATHKAITDQARRASEIPKITDMEVDSVQDPPRNGRVFAIKQLVKHSNGRKIFNLKSRAAEALGSVIVKIEEIPEDAPVNGNSAFPPIPKRPRQLKVPNSMKTTTQLFKRTRVPTDLPSTSTGLVRFNRLTINCPFRLLVP